MWLLGRDCESSSRQRQAAAKRGEPKPLPSQSAPPRPPSSRGRAQLGGIHQRHTRHREQGRAGRQSLSDSGQTGGRGVQSTVSRLHRWSNFHTRRRPFPAADSPRAIARRTSCTGPATVAQWAGASAPKRCQPRRPGTRDGKESPQCLSPRTASQYLPVTLKFAPDSLAQAHIALRRVIGTAAREKQVTSTPYFSSLLGT